MIGKIVTSKDEGVTIRGMQKVAKLGWQLSALRKNYVIGEVNQFKKDASETTKLSVSVFKAINEAAIRLASEENVIIPKNIALKEAVTKLAERVQKRHNAIKQEA